MTGRDLRISPKTRHSFLSVALVHIGMVTALDQFMLGAALGHSMTLNQAFLSILIGSLIFGIVTFGLGFAGMQEGLSSSLLARWCGFGRWGSALVSVVIALSLMGWFGVQNAVFAKGLSYALDGKIGFAWSATVSGIALTLLVAFGFKALRLTAKIAVPLFVTVITYISTLILTGQDAFSLLSHVPEGEALSVAAGTTLVVGGFIVASLVTPDLSRYSKNGRHVFWMTMASIIIGEFFINGLAILIAKSLNSSDVVTIMAQTVGGVGLLMVIFSTLRINDINLYSSSLSIQNTIEATTGKKPSYIAITLVIGFIGTTLSVLGIIDRFIEFLDLMGVLFPPILGIMLVDYYILKTHRALLHSTRRRGVLPEANETPLIGWPALFAWIVGSVVGFNIDLGVPAVNSILSASLFYWSACILFNKKIPANAF